MGFAVLLIVAPEAAAKVPGSKFCYNGICHRFMTLAETEKAVGTRTTARTSFYDDCSVDRFNTCALTSSGEVFKPYRPDNAASPIYPDGTKLLLWNPKTKVAAIVRVNSAGPYHSNRTLDVSRATAEKLGFKNTGVATLHVQILEAPTPAEARYKKRREYAPVPGPIGVYSDFQLAAIDALKLLPSAMSKLFSGGEVPPLARKIHSAPVVVASASAPTPKAAETSSASLAQRERRHAAAKPLFSGLMMSRAPMSSARVQSATPATVPGGKIAAVNLLSESGTMLVSKPGRAAANKKPLLFSASLPIRRSLGSGS